MPTEVDDNESTLSVDSFDEPAWGLDPRPPQARAGSSATLESVQLSMCVPRAAEPSPAEWRRRQQATLARMMGELRAAPPAFEPATGRAPSPPRTALLLRAASSEPSLNPLLLERDTPPRPPIGVSASLEGAAPFGQRIVVRWDTKRKSSAAARSAIVAFELEWEDAALGIWSHAADSIGGAARRFEIGSDSAALRHGRRRFRLRAQNSAGWGRWSGPSAILRIGAAARRRPRTSSTVGSRRPGTAGSAASSASSAARRDRWGGVKADPKTVAAGEVRERVKRYEQRVRAQKKRAPKGSAPPAPIAEWGGGALRDARPSRLPSHVPLLPRSQQPLRAAMAPPPRREPQRARVARAGPPPRPSASPRALPPRSPPRSPGRSAAVDAAATLSAMKQRERQLLMSLDRLDGKLLAREPRVY